MRLLLTLHLARHRSRWLVVVMLVVIMCLVAPQLIAQQQGVLDSAQDFYRQTTRTWLALAAYNNA